MSFQHGQNEQTPGSGSNSLRQKGTQTMPPDPDASMPLIVRDARKTAGFTQQGSIDWVALSRGTLDFTIQGISRLSQAGIEALTVFAARGIFLQVRLGALGQSRIEQAIKSVQALPSMNKTLWFGFGIKHVVRNLSETAEGLACVGICSCLTEEFSTSVSAQIIAELFLLYKPPEDLTPALSQWTALVKACQGVVATSEFGLTLARLSSLFLLDGAPNMLICSKPGGIAKVLKGLFDVSIGSTKSIVIVGGPDCAWFAAVAHWLLQLSVEIVDGNGDVLYRPGYVKDGSRGDTQVTLCYENQSVSSSIITRQRYFVPSGDRLIHRRVADSDIAELSILSHGRLLWSTCLVDTFGKPMKKLLTTSAAETGLALGAAARIFEHIACQGWHDSFPPGQQSQYFVSSHPVASASFGRGFMLKARDLLPELSQIPRLLNNLDSELNKSTSTAIGDFTTSMSSIVTMCACRLCQQADEPVANSEDSSKLTRHGEQNQFCCFILVMTILNLIRLSSSIDVPEQATLYPTRSGIERIYWELEKDTEDEFRYDDAPVDRLFRSWLNESVLGQALRLYSGRGVNQKSSTMVNACAIAAHGLCVYTNTLTEVTIDPERALSVKLTPGQIQWRSHTYDDAQDPYAGYARGLLGHPYSAKSASLETQYDQLKGLIGPDLQADLYVEEVVDSRSVTASWMIGHKQVPGSFTIGPRFIGEQVSRAHPAARCEEGCRRKSSLNGFRALVIEGEGAIETEHLDVSKGLPIIRPVGNSAMAVWMALADYGLHWAYSDGEESVKVQPEYMLQSRQCMRCCVMKADRFIRITSAGEIPVCLLTAL